MFRLPSFLKTFSSLKLQKTTLAKFPTLNRTLQWSFSTPTWQYKHLSQKLCFNFSQIQPRDASESEFKNLLSKYNLQNKQGALSRTDVLNMLTSLAQMTNPAAYSGFTLKYYLEAAKLAEELGINDTTEVGGLYVWIVTLYLNGEHVENIETCVEKGIQVYSNAAKNDEPGAKSGLIHLELARGIIHSKKGEFEKASGVFQEILKKQLEIPEEDLVMLLPQIYDNLGNISVNQGDLGEAVKHLEKALDTATKALGEDSEDIIALLNRLTDVEIKRNNYQQALDYANRSLNLSRKYYGEGDEKTRACEKTLTEIKGKL